MRLGYAAMLSGLALTACSLGSSSPESEPTEAATSLPVQTPSSSAEGEPEPPWADEEEARRRAESYKGQKCLGKRPTLVGTPGDDRIRTTDGDDVIMMLGGNDVIVGPRGGVLDDHDRFCPGTGDDQVIYVGLRFGGFDDPLHSRIVLGPGDDLIRGPDLRGGQGPCVKFVGARGPVRIDLARGRATGEGHDRFPRNTRCAAGGRFDDVLLGTPGNDRLKGGDGDDELKGGGGDDQLNAGDGDDELTGGGGDDAHNPGYGADLVRAGAGDDDVFSGWFWYWPVRGEGGDRIYLGPGDDKGDGGPGADRLYGGAGSDSLAGAPGGDYLDGGPGDDSLHAGSGCISTKAGQPPPFKAEACWDGTPNEVFGRSGNDLLSGDLGNDRLDGGPGFDSGSGGYHDGRIDWITSVERLRD